MNMFRQQLARTVTKVAVAGLFLAAWGVSAQDAAAAIRTGTEGGITTYTFHDGNGAIDPICDITVSAGDASVRVRAEAGMEGYYELYVNPGEGVFVSTNENAPTIYRNAVFYRAPGTGGYQPGRLADDAMGRAQAGNLFGARISNTDGSAACIAEVRIRLSEVTCNVTSVSNVYVRNGREYVRASWVTNNATSARLVREEWYGGGNTVISRSLQGLDVEIPLNEDSAIVIYGSDTNGASCEHGMRAFVNPQCSNNIDDDGNGRTDYPNDAGCSSDFDDDESNASRRCSIVSNKSLVDSGENFRITWEGRGATRYGVWGNDLSPISNAPSSGSRTVSHSWSSINQDLWQGGVSNQVRSFYLWMQNADGTTQTCDTQVDVAPTEGYVGAANLSITVNPVVVDQGDTLTVDWSVTGGNGLRRIWGYGIDPDVWKINRTNTSGRTTIRDWLRASGSKNFAANRLGKHRLTIDTFGAINPRNNTVSNKNTQSNYFYVRPATGWFPSCELRVDGVVVGVGTTINMTEGDRFTLSWSQQGGETDRLTGPDITAQSGSPGSVNVQAQTTGSYKYLVTGYETPRGNREEAGCSVTIEVEPLLPECSDRRDNDDDLETDATDPGCWYDPRDPTSGHNPNDDDENDAGLTIYPTAPAVELYVNNSPDNAKVRPSIPVQVRWSPGYYVSGGSGNSCVLTPARFFTGQNANVEGEIELPFGAYAEVRYVCNDGGTQDYQDGGDGGQSQAEVKVEVLPNIFES